MKKQTTIILEQPETITLTVSQLLSIRSALGKFRRYTESYPTVLDLYEAIQMSNLQRAVIMLVEKNQTAIDAYFERITK